MRKSGFIEGAFIATLVIFIVKVLGIVYIIPFYSMVGMKGSILYGYAYSIYAIFLSLSTSGIAIAISRTVSEYNALGFFNLKERIYKLAATLIISLGIICFFVLIIFAPHLARIILGELRGGNTIEEVTMVIRLISLAFLIVPVFSVTKGYLQGHRFIYLTSMATLLEQVVRVAIITFGSFVLIKGMGYNIEVGVGAAVVGASMGAVVAYGYLLRKIKKHRKDLLRDELPSAEEKAVTNKQLILRIITYAMPFVFIDVFKSGLYLVDTLTVVRTMVSLGQSEIAEVTLGIMNSLGNKLNMIIISISMGITISLIPNISASYAKKNYADINLKINQTLQALIFIGLPMTLGIYFLVQPVWIIFYSYDPLSITIFKLYVFQAIIFSVFSVLVNTFQIMNNTKYALGTVIAVVVFKSLLNIPMMKLFDSLSWPLYYSSILLTMIIQISAIIFLIVMLTKKYNFNILKQYKNFVKTFVIVAIMMIVLKIANLFIPIAELNKLGAIREVFIFSVIGTIIYLWVSFKSGLVYDVFGKRIVDKIILNINKNIVLFKK